MKPIFTLVIAALLLASAPAFAGEVTVLAETEYFPATLNAINHAKSDIAISMYLIEFNPNDTADPALKLTEALINAEKRGVKVKVVLENEKYKANMNAYNMLRDAGVAAYFDSPNSYIHEKLVIIDRETSIIGSHNWTRASLTGNNDASVLIRAADTADELLAHISSIRLTQPIKLQTGSGLTLPVSLFKGNDSPVAKLFSHNADVLFDLYLVLLREGKPSLTADYERLGKAIGLDREKKKGTITAQYYRNYYKDNVAKFLVKLRDGYGLIRYDDGSGKVEIVDLGSKEVGARKTEYIQLPLAYFEYGWDKRLTFADKYFYLISLNESKDSKDAIWWEMSAEKLDNKYGINVNSIRRAVAELQRYDIIDIFRESAKKRDLLWYKPPNKYLLNALYDPMTLKRSFLKLEQKYGVKITEQAIGLAEELNVPNNLADIERFIKLIKQYGYEKVKAANAKTVALAPGAPKRHIGYTIRVLEGEKD